VTNPRFARFALDAAQERGLPVQEAVRAGGGTDGGCIHTVGGGVPTIVLSVPVRYAHAPCGVSSFADFEALVELTAAMIHSMNRDTIAGFTPAF
jgi:putative aminopeptidase FrvX